MNSYLLRKILFYLSQNQIRRLRKLFRKNEDIKNVFGKLICFKGLGKACLDGNYFGVTKLIQAYPNKISSKIWSNCKNYNYQNLNIRNAFEGACQNGYYDLVTLMVRNNVRLWEHGLQGACRGGQRDLVDLLIMKGANWWDGGVIGACQGGHYELVEKMLKMALKSNQQYSYVRDTHNCFYIACKNGHVKITELFIEHKLDDIYGGLYIACYEGHQKIVNLILNQAKKNNRKYPICGSWSGLDFIMFHRDVSYLNYGRDVSYLNYGLAGACHGGHRDLAELMISLGANNWNDGLYATCYGDRNDDPKIYRNLAELMIQRGASEWKSWFFEHARRGGNLEMIDLALSLGANLNHNLAIKYVSQKKDAGRSYEDNFYIGLLDLLIKHRGNIFDWNVGLITAIGNGNKEFVHLMIDRGANCWDDGLKVAQKRKDRYLIDLMVKKGAKLV